LVNHDPKIASHGHPIFRSVCPGAKLEVSVDEVMVMTKACGDGVFATPDVSSAA